MAIVRNLTGGGVAALALLLAACGGGNDGAAADNASDETAAAASVEQIPPELQRDPTNAVVPLAPPSPSPMAAAIPAAFHGRWGMGDADCDPAQADGAKGLLVVASGGVTHYESRGRPTRVEAVGANRITADLAFTGEGQEWTRRTTYTLLDAGRTLTAETPEDPEAPMRTLRYIRCPA